ncbi:MAG: 50S ribosomal protein L19 [Candidatus Saccharibacteria bacterium GW2011_GWA2_46_10]|nr:MAG: 50S ribosomal protein L19 [Candidatus Saccharibacteria bacterium GW2011_GWA2_46_10]OGL36208.1 MAG: 50S ribosomal protein L19 [Candidatus Saccharibacteria bacterium RIFCSPHIGHO2_12_FULL_47_17]
MSREIQALEQSFKKKAVVDVQSGDSVRVHQKVLEAGKTRVQIFEGMVIRTKRAGSLTASFTVRRVASGVGVEKTYLIHSPSVTKVEVIKRSKVRRNYLSYMRGLRGKGARLSGVEFDREAVNVIEDETAESEEAKIKAQQAKAHEEAEAAKAEEEAKREAKVEELLSKHEPASTTEESLESLKDEADPTPKT